MKPVRVPLSAPYEENWIACDPDLPMADLFDLQDAAVALRKVRASAVDARTIVDSIADLVGRLVTSHNLLDTSGGPLVLSARTMGPRLLVVLTEALSQAQGEGESADPLPKKAILRDHLSPARKSRRGSPSTK